MNEPLPLNVMARRIAEEIVHEFESRAMTRARISEKTIKDMIGTPFLRLAFMNLLIMEFDHVGYTLVRLGRGGFGLFYTEILAGAPMLTFTIKKKQERK